MIHHDRPPVPRRAPGLLARLPRVAWLTLVWVLLWGTFTPQSVLGGVVVAVIVTALFPMPRLLDRLSVRPLRLLGLAVFLLYDLAASSVEVAWQILRRGTDARGAIVVVPLLTTSDRVITIMANALSLSPGAMALQIDQEHKVWYVYALGPRDRAGAERARLRTLDMQRRVLAAFGTAEELAEARRRIVQEGGPR
ncbi:Na+/H+ antiporter subunit E [Pseudonocardia sp. CA-142604]|uniref:Na+/H+ antiporter subunit E n=1 Tax=Pseudonocardia sp. CA-142604 TaxID=3240024 RepID=UPI003D8D3F0C